MDAHERGPENAGRRRLIAALTAATGAAASGVLLPKAWNKSIVNTVMIPVHAQGSLTVGATDSFAGQGGPVPIPDYDLNSEMPGGVASMDFNVSGMPGTIVAVRLALNITHTWIHDLRVQLTGGGQTDVILFNQVCQSEDNIDITLDDTAPQVIGAVCSNNLTGTFRTVGHAFSDFVGGNPNGTWTLEVLDFGGADTGTLQSATLFIDTTG